MKKKGLLLITLGLFSYFSYSQIDSLALATMDERQKISLLLDAYKDYQFKVSDYRIQIFSGGLNQAQEIEKEARETYETWPVSLDFISPSYRVRVGAFKTRLEAEKNLIALRKKHPAAVLLKPKKIQ